MTRTQFRFRLIAQAMFQRRKRLSIALGSLVVGATLAAALLTTYADLDRKMAGEFRRYGANLIIAPVSGTDWLSADVLDHTVQQNVTAIPFLYVIGRANGRDIVLGGADLQRLRDSAPSWKLTGNWPVLMNECLAGERLGLHAGDRVQVAVGDSQRDWRVSGVVATGASEDSQLLASLTDVSTLAGAPGRLSLIQVIAPPRQLEETRARLAAALPDAEVRVLRAVAESTAQVLLRVRGLLYASSLVILVIVAMGVATTLYAIVFDRRRDIAVMKALGADEAQVALLLIAESAVLGLASGLIGCLTGLAAAEWVGREIYQSSVSVKVAVLPEVMLLTVGVAVVATLFPLRLARAVSPAAMLKGD